MNQPPGEPYQQPPGQQPPYIGYPADLGYGGYPPGGTPQYPYAPGPPPPHKTHRLRNTLIGAGAFVVFVVFVLVVVGALTSTKAAHHGSAASSSPGSLGPLTERVGGTFRATITSGTVYDVTLVKVVDPAQGSGIFSQPESGSHLVAAVFRISGVSGTSTDDSNLDASLTGTNGKVYVAAFDTIAGYSNFNAGDFKVTPGQTETGAVSFQVPNGVKVRNVQWTIGFDASTATWDVG
jgi:hypothetical protein